MHPPLSTENPEVICLRLAGADHGALYYGKYNVTQEMYPPFYRYPRYCNGQCSLLNRKALE